MRDLIVDYRETLAGEFGAGAPDTLVTRWGAFYYALRRALRRWVGLAPR